MREPPPTATHMRWRKRPIVVEAQQYAGRGNMHPRYHGRVADWIWEAFAAGVLMPTNGTDPLIVRTKEGDLIVSPGDWIVRGVQGELYPCKPDIFEATYEPAADD